MELGEVITNVREEYGDVAAAQIASTQIRRWVNQAILDIVKRTDCVVASFSGNLAAGTREYDGSAYLKIRSVTVTESGGLVRHLKRIRKPDLERFQEISSDARAVPTKFYFEWDMLGFHPLPDSAYAYTVSHVPYIADMLTDGTDDGDELPIPKLFHRDVVTWCLERCARQDGDLQRAQQYANEYEFRIAESLHNQHNQDTESFAVVREVDDDVYYNYMSGH